MSGSWLMDHRPFLATLRQKEALQLFALVGPVCSACIGISSRLDDYQV